MLFITNQNQMEKVEKIRRVAFTLLGVWTVFVGALFILQTWRIFLSDGGFTVESVSTRFLEILLPFLLWIFFVAFCGVYSLLFPVFEKPTAYTSSCVALRKLKARIPKNQGGRYALNARFVAWIICGIVAIICAIVAGVYLLNASYEQVSQVDFFAEHEEAERLVFALVWIVAAFGVAIAVSVFDERSLRKEIALVKLEIAENAKNGVVLRKTNVVKRSLENKKITLFFRLAIGVVALVLIVVGVANGGMADVFGKAINICTQCIGLG